MEYFGAARGSKKNSFLLMAICHIVFAVAILVSSMYQLSNAIKLMTPIVCVVLAGMGFLLNKKTGAQFAYIFVAYVSCLAVLSLLGFMNGSWTTMRTSRLLFQQASIHAFIPLAAFGFAFILCKIGDSIPKLSLLYIFPITIATVYVYKYSNQAGMTTDIFIINNLYSVEVFRVFFIGVLLLTIRSNFLFIILFAVVSYFAFSLQAKLCMIIILTVRFVPVYRWMIVVGVISAAVAALTATFFWQQLLDIDNNIGVRALFWHNVLVALLDTHFIGVGYGTESIVPFYPSHGVIRYFGPRIPSEYSVIGVHSSFFQSLFNTGIAGFMLLTSWIFICLGRIGGKNGIVQPIDVLACGILFVSIFTNMALDSYNFIIGSTFLLGWIIYRGVYSKDYENNAREAAMRMVPSTA